MKVMLIMSLRSELSCKSVSIYICMNGYVSEVCMVRLMLV